MTTHQDGTRFPTGSACTMRSSNGRRHKLTPAQTASGRAPAYCVIPFLLPPPKNPCPARAKKASQAGRRRFDPGRPKDSKALLLEYLASIRDPERAASLFAADGVFELPFLRSLGGR